MLPARESTYDARTLGNSPRSSCAAVSGKSRICRLPTLSHLDMNAVSNSLTEAINSSTILCGLLR
jgi:hypothetical protein